MYSPYLETFLCVADVGSFNKAANELYISTSAVNKQISALEASLRARLFVRERSGLTLTAAGKSLYGDSKDIIQHCRASAERARNATHLNDGVVRVGVSPITPGQIFWQIWPSVHAQCPELNFQLVPFLYSTQEEEIEVFKSLGHSFDIIAGPFRDKHLGLQRHQVMELRQMRPCCGVPIQHRLAGRKSLTVQDLYGENLMLLRPGEESYFDLIRDDLQKNHPQIFIEDLTLLSSESFNQCVRENHLILAIDEWERMHPSIVMIPVDWAYRIPCSLMYAAVPSPSVWTFLNAVQGIIAR